MSKNKHEATDHFWPLAIQGHAKPPKDDGENSQDSETVVNNWI